MKFTEEILENVRIFHADLDLMGLIRQLLTQYHISQIRDPYRAHTLSNHPHPIRQHRDQLDQRTGTLDRLDDSNNSAQQSQAVEALALHVLFSILPVSHRLQFFQTSCAHVGGMRQKDQLIGLAWLHANPAKPLARRS